MQSPPPPPMQHPQCQTPPFFFNSPTLSSTLHPICANNAPLAAPPRSQQASVEFIQIFWHFASPHFPSRNDLWQLEMGSVGGASSDTLPPPTPPLCRKADFLFRLASFYPSSFIHRCSSCQLVKTLKAPLIFFRLTPQCDRQTGWYSSICWHLVFAVFFVAFAQCPPTVWSCTDTMSGTSEGNPPPTFVWILMRLQCYKVTPCIAF